MKLLIIISIMLFSSYVFSGECLIELSEMQRKSESINDLVGLASQRKELHQKLSSFSNDCKIKLKDLFLEMREKEDFIASHSKDFPQVSAEAIDFKIASPAIYARYPKIEFKTGDVMITKGISFTSATISEVVSPRSLFSHIVFIYVDESTKKVFTLESYIGYGAKIFSIEDALKNENVRILLLRAKDQETAKKAGSYMYERIQAALKNKKPIPYDYELNFADNSKLSCEEIAYEGFKKASDGKMILPENLSQVKLNDESFLNRLGIKKGSLMMPADMEIDSRFDLILDWTDYRIVRDSIRKDAVMGVMFQWMNDHQYKIHDNFKSMAAKLIWSTRYIPGLWNLLARLSGIPVDFQKDVPSLAISTIESLKSIAGKILEYITLKDEEHRRDKKRWMTSLELRNSIGHYIGTKPDTILSDFHN